MAWIQQWFASWLYPQNNWENIVIAITIFLVLLILRKLLVKYVFKFILKITNRSKVGFASQILLAFEKPLQIFLIIVGLKISLSYIFFQPMATVWLTKLFRSSIILIITWGIFSLTRETSGWIRDLMLHFKIDVDQIIIPFISKLIRFFILVLSISVVAQEWDYHVTGLITGLGIGGFAFAFAAKDAIGNIFGGLVIITEKPFTIGDWIETPSVEGFVEDITFRSTRVRMFAEALVTVPNSKLANESIINWSKMGQRNISFKLQVVYMTPRRKLENCIESIRDMLRAHPEVDNDTINVHFYEFNHSGMNILLHYFTSAKDWTDWLRVKEECNFKILKIIEDHEITIALPSRSIYYNNRFSDEEDESTPETFIKRKENKQNSDGSS